MRVLFLNPVGEMGGAERILLDVAQSLREVAPRLELGLLCLGDGPLVQAAAARGMDVSVLELPPGLAQMGDSALLEQGGGEPSKRRAALASLGRARGLVPYLGRLHTSLRRWKPDLLHSNGIKAHLLSALVRPGRKPLVWHVHDYLSQRPAVRRLLAVLSQRATAAVAISESVRQDALGVLGALPVHTALNAVDLDRFAPGPSEGAWLDAQAHDATGDEPVLRVGLVATYGRWKGHELFLDAAAWVRQQTGLPKMRFYIVGGPIYRTVGSQYSQDELTHAAHVRGILEHVRFVPYQHETERVYRSLDVVVHASTRPEPFGLTIAEAMACGRATLVAQAGGAGELFTDGVDAQGYAPGDVEALAKGMAALCGDAALRARLSNNARATAQARFSRARLGREVWALYQQLLT